MIIFNNIDELYIKVKPILKIKQEELKKQKTSLTEKDIFEYLKEKKWKKAKNLRFYEIVNDIIKLDGDDLIEKK